MRILDSVKHPDGVWVQGTVSSLEELTNFDSYVLNRMGSKPVEGSIICDIHNSDFYIKDSSGAWSIWGETDENQSVSAVSISTNKASLLESPITLATDELSETNKLSNEDERTVIDDPIVGHTESE